MRKNKFVEILPINVGCLGACTYCKTKHARGHLGSYTVDSLVSTVTSFPFICFISFAYCNVTLQVGRVRSVVADGVKEIWLSSEDTGAYGNFNDLTFHVFCISCVEAAGLVYLFDNPFPKRGKRKLKTLKLKLW